MVFTRKPQKQNSALCPGPPQSLWEQASRSMVHLPCKSRRAMAREQFDLQWARAKAVFPWWSLYAKHEGSCYLQSFMLTVTTTFSSRLSSCLAGAAHVLNGAAPQAQQHQTVTDRLTGPCEVQQAAHILNRWRFMHTAAVHFQSLSQWNRTYFPRVTVPLQHLSKLQAEPDISSSKRAHQ